MSHVQHDPRHIPRPDHAVRNAFLEPILFLGDLMAATVGNRAEGERTVDRLGEFCAVTGFRGQQSYQRLTEDAACEMLSNERARTAALVVLALVLKTDSDGGEEAKAFFSRIREKLGQEPIAVPSHHDEHLGLALQFLRD